MVLRLWQVRARVSSRCRRGVRPAQDPPQAAERRLRSARRSRPLAVHDLRQLPAGLPEGGGHDQDHARRPRGGDQSGQAGSGRAAGRLREHVQAGQRARPERAQARRLDEGRRRAGAPAAQGARTGRVPALRRGLLVLPPARPRRRPGLRADLPCARDRLRDPRPRGAHARRFAASGRGEGPLRDARRAGRRDARQVRVRADRHARPARLQRAEDGLPEARPPLRRRALHAAARPARRPPRVDQGARLQGHVPRSRATWAAITASTTRRVPCWRRSPA